MSFYFFKVSWQTVTEIGLQTYVSGTNVLSIRLCFSPTFVILNDLQRARFNSSHEEKPCENYD